MAQHGGKRQGAGKKKGTKASHTIEASIAKARIITRVSERIDELVDVLFEKAIGSKDVTAIKELFDRGFGKPMQSMELGGVDGKDLIPELSPNVIKLIDDYTHKRGETTTS